MANAFTTPLLAAMLAASVLSMPKASVAQDQNVILCLRATGKVEMEDPLRTYKLTMSVANLGESPVNCTLEWYFIKASIKNDVKGDPEICEKGSAPLSIAAKGKANQSATSRSLALTTSGKKKTVRNGDSFEGFIAVVRYNGNIVAKEASYPKFLANEWLSRLDGPVRSEDTKESTADSGNTKRKSKKK